MLLNSLLLIPLLSTAVASVLESNASLTEGQWSIDHIRYERPPKLQQDWTMQRLVILPDHKLLFCYIEKVAGTSFNSLFNHIAGHKTNRLKNMWFLNDFRRRGLKMRDVIGLLGNESWHKAVFYRDPVDRFVSAYISKCVLRSKDKFSRKGSRHCKDIFGNRTATFHQALKVVSQVSAIGNAHWLQQFQFCGDLRKHLSSFETVELLEPGTMNLKVKRMLSRASILVTEDIVAAVDQYFPLMRSDNDSSSGTSDWRRGAFTNASAEARSFFEASGGGAENLAAVVRHYIEDYRLFNMTVAPWQLDMLRSPDGGFDDVLQRLPYLPQPRE